MYLDIDRTICLLYKKIKLSRKRSVWKKVFILNSAHNFIYQRVLDEIYPFLYKRRNVSVVPLIDTEQPQDLARQELPSNAARIFLYCGLD